MEIRCLCHDISVNEIARKLVSGENVEYGKKCKLCLTYVEKEVELLLNEERNQKAFRGCH